MVTPAITKMPLVIPGRRREYLDTDSDVTVQQNPPGQPRDADESVTVVTDIALNPAPNELFEWNINGDDLAPDTGATVLNVGDFVIAAAKEYFQSAIDLYAGGAQISITLNITDIPPGINNIQFQSEGSGILGQSGFDGASDVNVVFTCLTPDVEGNLLDILSRPIGFIGNATTLEVRVSFNAIVSSGVSGNIFAGWGFNFLERDYGIVDFPVRRQFFSAIGQTFLNYNVDRVVPVYNITSPTLLWGTQGDYKQANSDSSWSLAYNIPFSQGIIACSCIFEFVDGGQTTVVGNAIAAIIPDGPTLEDAIVTTQFESKSDLTTYVDSLTTGGSPIDRGGQYGIANTVSFTGSAIGSRIKTGFSCPLCSDPSIYGVEYYKTSTSCNGGFDVSQPGVVNNFRFNSQILTYDTFLGTAPAKLGNQVKKTLYYSAEKFSSMGHSGILSSGDVYGISVARVDPFVEVYTVGSNQASTMVTAANGCQEGAKPRGSSNGIINSTSLSITDQNVGPHTYTPDTEPMLYQIEYYSQEYVDQFGIPPVNDGAAPPDPEPVEPVDYYYNMSVTVDSTDYVMQLGYTQEEFLALPLVEQDAILRGNQPERLVVPMDSIVLADGEVFDSAIVTSAPGTNIRVYPPVYDPFTPDPGIPAGTPPPAPERSVIGQVMEFVGDYGPLIQGAAVILSGGTLGVAAAVAARAFIRGEIKNVAFDTAETAVNSYRFRDTGRPATPTDPRSLTYRYIVNGN